MRRVHPERQRKFVLVAYTAVKPRSFQLGSRVVVLLRYLCRVDNVNRKLRVINTLVVRPPHSISVVRTRHKSRRNRPTYFWRYPLHFPSSTVPAKNVGKTSGYAKRGKPHTGHCHDACERACHESSRTDCGSRINNCKQLVVGLEKLTDSPTPGCRQSVVKVWAYNVYNSLV